MSTDLAARPRRRAAAALNVESSAAFDSYVQWKAKELGIDLATIPEPQRGGGNGGGGAARAAAARWGCRCGGAQRRWRARERRPGARRGAGAGGAAAGDPGNPTGMAALTRWTNGRFPRAFDFIQQQRRRYILISQMQDLLKDVDMYVPGNGNFDVGLHAQTGHPCVVVPYKFEAPPQGRGGGGGASAGAGRTRRRGAGTAEPNKPQPICAVIAGNLYNDDKILSVAHQYQIKTGWQLKHPAI